ncbi:hypothetical protein Pint_00242 [Pistacia integerrima]|uniref:Uncharacterized protein n=1 Tax=Pistacia integerrima TaxID=434235 RepID=A0ACC0ZIB6_9ROSI|nr:hypothetical protein Pint_00242 [Pistacia integerrima]
MKEKFGEIGIAALLHMLIRICRNYQLPLIQILTQIHPESPEKITSHKFKHN